MSDTLYFKIIGIGTPPSFKNGKIIVRVPGGGQRLVTRADRAKWMRQAIKQLETQRVEHGIKRAEKNTGKWNKVKRTDGRSVRVHVKWDGKGRLADPDGMLSTVMDCLVRSGVLADDSPRYVTSACVGWHYNPETPSDVCIAIWQETLEETDWYDKKKGK